MILSIFIGNKNDTNIWHKKYWMKMTASSSFNLLLPIFYSNHFFRKAGWLNKNGCYCYFKSIILRIVFLFLYDINLLLIAWRTGLGLCQLLMIVNASGTRTCIHPQVSRLLTRWVMDDDWQCGERRPLTT